MHAALTLDRLEHHRADPVVDRRGERVDVGEEDLAEPRRQRLETLLLLGLAGRGERGERPTVERPVRRDHVEALGPAVRLSVAAGELDRGLVRLGAGVGEEHTSDHRRGGRRGGRRPGLHRVVVEVRDVEQRAGLIGDRVGHDRVRVTERRHREPAQEVEVLVALGVVEARPLAAHERDRAGGRTSASRAPRRARQLVEWCHACLPLSVAARRAARAPLALLAGTPGSRSLRSRCSRGHDHGSDAFSGEELEEQRVRDPAVEDVGAGHPVAQRLDARCDLRDHPLVERCRSVSSLEPGDVGAGDQRVDSSGSRGTGRPRR